MLMGTGNGNVGKHVRITYLNDNNEKRHARVILLELNKSFVRFQTEGDNILTIPIARMLKLKENVKGDRTGSETSDSGSHS